MITALYIVIAVAIGESESQFIKDSRW